MTTSSCLRGVLLGAAIAAGMGIGYAIGAQPHMNESIALLQSARGELQAATPNKGGHRERALGLIDQPIGEVRAGIAVCRRLKKFQHQTIYQDTTHEKIHRSRFSFQQHRRLPASPMRCRRFRLRRRRSKSSRLPAVEGPMTEEKM
jgi:hypothetical protein